MRKTAQPKIASTQSFTEILDIRENIVIQKGGNACIIVQVNSVNFALLSNEEQDSRVLAYASLLNSLSFPIQIVVTSKRIHMLPYLTLLEEEVKKTTNQKLALDINKYRQFVQTLLTTSVILDKQFYIVIPYSSLEAGLKSALPQKNTQAKQEDFFTMSQSALETKAEGIIGQLDRLSLRGKILEKDQLIALFHDIYNPATSLFKNPTQILSPESGGEK